MTAARVHAERVSGSTSITQCGSASHLRRITRLTRDALNRRKATQKLGQFRKVVDLVSFTKNLGIPKSRIRDRRSTTTLGPLPSLSHPLQDIDQRNQHGDFY
jgi:hypothetical protein